MSGAEIVTIGVLAAALCALLAWAWLNGRLAWEPFKRRLADSVSELFGGVGGSCAPPGRMAWPPPPPEISMPPVRAVQGASAASEEAARGAERAAVMSVLDGDALLRASLQGADLSRSFIEARSIATGMIRSVGSNAEMLPPPYTPDPAWSGAVLRSDADRPAAPDRPEPTGRKFDLEQ